NSNSYLKDILGDILGKDMYYPLTFVKPIRVSLVYKRNPKAQCFKASSQDDPLDSSVQGLVTPSTTKVNASGEEQVEDISPNTLEAAKTLSKVASLKPRSIDKGRRYKRRKEAKGKKVVSSLDFQEEVDTGAEQVNTAEGNTSSIKLSTVSEQLSTGSEQVSTKKSTSSHDKGQREGKAPMISEETPKKSKEQILQEEASLAEAIRLDSLQKEEEAKQINLDSLLAQRIAEEEELNEQQKKRKAQVQFEAQHYTNEDWDLIRAKIEANAELSKSMLGSELQGEDFAKKMVDLVNQRKKYFAEERARAKRNKPMTQSQLKTYMMNYLKNQGTWKLSQLKNLSFEEVKEEFDKLVKQVESFAPINFEATKASLKRFGEELQTKTPKRLKDDEAKDDEPTKKSGKRRKQMARRGLHTNIDKDDSEGSDEVSEQDDSVTGTKIPINPVPVAMKTPSIATYKIFKQGEKGAYQIVREDGTDIVYINFGAMLKVISRDDLTELYRIVMNRYGMDGPEDELEKVFWKYLKNMFEEPLSTDPIWSELGQQRIISWRYYESCRVHCLNLESMDIYMLIERTYPLSAEMCKAMLDKKLQGGKPDENCYKMLKMMEKQAGSHVAKNYGIQLTNVSCTEIEMVFVNMGTIDGWPKRTTTPEWNAANGKPVAPTSPDYVPGPEHPPSPDYVPGPEHPPSLVEVPYVPEPEYPGYLVPSDDEAPLEDQPLPIDDSLIALLLGYVADFDPEEDQEEDPKEDHADYPANGGDDDDDPSDNDDDDDDTDDEDEEEHLAPADSSVVPVVDLVPSTRDTEAFEMDESAPTPRSPQTKIPSPPLPPLPSSLHLPPLVPTSLPLPLSPLPASLFISPVDHREDIPEAELPTSKRLCLTAPTLRYEVGESSTTAPRPTRGHRVDYGFIGTLEAETRCQRAEEVGYGIRDVWVDSTEAVEEVAPMTLEEVNARVTELVAEALASQEAWAHLVGLSLAVQYELQAYKTHTWIQDHRIASRESLSATLIAQISSLQGQLSMALGQI
ncbi:hypothetical protein Tco_0270055, partial [Tanacetum coccineum]